MNKNDIITNLNKNLKIIENDIMKDSFNSVKVFQKKVLDILINYESNINEIFSHKESKNENIWYKEKVLSRYFATYFKNEINFKSLDNLLEILWEKELKILMSKIKKLDFDIFKKEKVQIKKWVNDKESKVELKTRWKYSIFIKLLKKLNYNLDDIIQYEEKINTDRMRTIPYLIVQLNKKWKERTVLISDEIWQASFVYEWILEPDDFLNIEKWEEIKWIKCRKIIYNKDSYAINLRLLLENDFVDEKIGKNFINEEKEIADSKLESFDDYKSYLENNRADFEEYWILFGENWDKTVDLSWIKNPNKFKLFWYMALTWLRNLNKALWNIDKWEVVIIPYAWEILADFFEKSWYIVTKKTEKKEKVKLYCFNDCKIYFENNREEFEGYWILFGQNWDKTVDLSWIKNPNKFKLFLQWAKSWLRNLNRVLWNMDKWLVENIEYAWEILTEFFEKIWYIVIQKPEKKEKVEKVLFNNQEDYRLYFENIDNIKNQKEIKDSWIIIDLINNTIDLRYILNPCSFNLFWQWAVSWLRNFNKFLWNEDKWNVVNITDAVDILYKYFLSIWYEVILESKKLCNIEDYMWYFKTNITEFENSWIIINEENNTVDLSWIKNPCNYRVFWQLGSCWLRNLNKALWNDSNKKVESKSFAIEILSKFFETIGYVVKK